MADVAQGVPTVAAFDFDGTITTRDSLLPFLTYTFGWVRFLFGILCATPQLIGFPLGIVTRQRVKERLLRHFFGGTPHAALQQQAARYADERLPQLVKKEAIERLRWHQEQGHTCVLISASIETYLIPWAKAHAFDAVIASRLEVDAAGCVTGALRGKNCRDEEKVVRLEKEIGPIDSYFLYAYGDSEGDRALLSIADTPFYRIMPPPNQG